MLARHCDELHTLSNSLVSYQFGLSDRIGQARSSPVRLNRLIEGWNDMELTKVQIPNPTLSTQKPTRLMEYVGPATAKPTTKIHLGKSLLPLLASIATDLSLLVLAAA
jgi:hypothetical protein